jgi:hypothetical protein
VVPGGPREVLKASATPRGSRFVAAFVARVSVTVAAACGTTAQPPAPAPQVDVGAIAIESDNPTVPLGLDALLRVGDPADERKHAYVSSTASGVDTLSARYEWGVDHVGATAIDPATRDTGRHMTGTSEFSLAIAPAPTPALLACVHAWASRRNDGGAAVSCRRSEKSAR